MASSAPPDADLAARLQEELRETIGPVRGEEAPGGPARFPGPSGAARAIWCKNDVASVRAEFQSRFKHLFVDEFQDTDPLQAEILLLLAADDAGETDWRRVTADDAGSSFSSRIRSNPSTASGARMWASIGEVCDSTHRRRREASCG